MLKRTPVKRRRSGVRRGPWRSRAYRIWISQHESILGDFGVMPGARTFDGSSITQACHTGPTNGMSSKSRDATCVPLTVEEHLRYDDKSKRRAFETEVKRETGKTLARHAAEYYQQWLSEGNKP